MIFVIITCSIDGSGCLESVQHDSFFHSDIQMVINSQCLCQPADSVISFSDRSFQICCWHREALRWYPYQDAKPDESNDTACIDIILDMRWRSIIQSDDHFHNQSILAGPLLMIMCSQWLLSHCFIEPISMIDLFVIGLTYQSSVSLHWKWCDERWSIWIAQICVYRTKYEHVVYNWQPFSQCVIWSFECDRLSSTVSVQYGEKTWSSQVARYTRRRDR